MYVVKISDGLGNQMFQYAFARRLQIVSGKKVYLDTRFINNEDRLMREGEKNIFMRKSDYREYGLNNFRIHIPVADEKTLIHWKFMECRYEIDKIILQMSKDNRWFFQYLQEDQDSKTDFMSRISRSASTYFEGYFFDKSYYEGIKDILQKEFRLKKPIKLSSELREALKDKDTVSIHVRRGDFLRLNRDISQKGYYSNAIEEMCAYIKNPVWLVFSDDIEWVKKNLYISGIKLYVSEMGYRDYEELTIMKNCKNQIVANSTFSYWAAYLNSYSDKIVICPKNWKSRIIPETWIKM